MGPSTCESLGEDRSQIAMETFQAVAESEQKIAGGIFGGQEFHLGHPDQSDSDGLKHLHQLCTKYRCIQYFFCHPKVLIVTPSSADPKALAKERNRIRVAERRRREKGYCASDHVVFQSRIAFLAENPNDPRVIAAKERNRQRIAERRKRERGT